MAFSAAGMNCIAVGPTNLYIYNSTDSINAASYTYFNTTNTPKLAAGDVIIMAHNTNALMALVRITAIDETSATYTGVTALA